MSQFFMSGGQSIGVSAVALILPMNIQDWFPLGLFGSPCSPRDSQKSPTPWFKSINSLALTKYNILFSWAAHMSSLVATPEWPSPERTQNHPLAWWLTSRRSFLRGSRDGGCAVPSEAQQATGNRWVCGVEKLLVPVPLEPNRLSFWTALAPAGHSCCPARTVVGVWSLVPSSPPPLPSPPTSQPCQARPLSPEDTQDLWGPQPPRWLSSASSQAQQMAKPRHSGSCGSRVTGNSLEAGCVLALRCGLQKSLIMAQSGPTRPGPGDHCSVAWTLSPTAPTAQSLQGNLPSGLCPPDLLDRPSLAHQTALLGLWVSMLRRRFEKGLPSGSIWACSSYGTSTPTILLFVI